MRNLNLTAFCAISLLLCGCLGKMERITEETRDTVKASNQGLKEAGQGQLLLDAKNTMINKDVSFNVRVASAEIFLLRAPELLLWKVIGAPMPLNVPMIERTVTRNHEEVEVGFPNVTVVGEPRAAAEWQLAPVDARDFYPVLKRAASGLIDQLTLKSLMPGQTAADMDELRADARRLLVVAPVVMGAIAVRSLDLWAMPGAGRQYVNSEAERQQTVDGLERLARQLAFPSEVFHELRTIAEAKLGVTLH